MPVFSVPDIAQTVNQIADRLHTIAVHTGHPELLKQIDELHQRAHALFHVDSDPKVRLSVDSILKLATTIVGTLSALPLPLQAEAALTIVKMLLPVIQQAVDTFWPEGGEPAVAASRGPSVMAQGFFQANAEVIRATDQKS